MEPFHAIFLSLLVSCVSSFADPIGTLRLLFILHASLKVLGPSHDGARVSNLEEKVCEAFTFFNAVALCQQYSRA
jgi:hypothetical protein